MKPALSPALNETPGMVGLRNEGVRRRPDLRRLVDWLVTWLVNWLVEIEALQQRKKHYGRASL